MDWSSCRFRFHGWFLFGRWKQTTGGRIPLLHPNTKKKHQTAFLQNYGDGWLEPTIKKMCILPQKGLRIPTGYNPPREKLRSVMQRLSKPGKSIRLERKLLGMIPHPGCRPELKLTAYPLLEKRTLWMETGMEMKRFWQVQDLAAPLCGETYHRYVFWRLEIWTIFEDLMGRTMGSDASKDHQLGEYPWACPPSSDHKYHHNHH